MTKKRVFGVIPGPNDVRNYQAVCAAKDEDFPEEFEIEDLAEGWDQDKYGACTCFAMCTIMETHCRRQGDFFGRLSPWFLYGYRSNNYRGIGRHTDHVMKDARRLGTVPYDKFPHEMEAPQIVDRVNLELVPLVADAYPYRITSTYTLTLKSAIKAELMRGNPVFMVVEWYDDIWVDDDGLIHTNRKGGGSYHAVVMYGWDERGWKFQNSWGKEWGVNGRAVWPYLVPLHDARGVTDEYSEAQQALREKEYQAKIESLTNEAAGMRQELLNLTSAYEEAVSIAEEQRERTHGLESKMAEIEDEKRQADARCEELSAQIKNLRVELQAQMETAGESIEALKNAIEIKQSELAFVEAERADFISVIRELNAELTQQKELEAQIKELRAECANHTSAYVNVVAELETARAEKEEADRKLLEIKKPFSSGVGQIIAKVVNFLMKLLYKEGKDGADT